MLCGVPFCSVGFPDVEGKRLFVVSVVTGWQVAEAASVLGKPPQLQEDREGFQAVLMKD